MKKYGTIGILVLIVIAILLYISQEKDSPIKPLTDKQSNAHVYTLKVYQDRFARNNYHLEKALESINKLKEWDYTVSITEDASTTLKILHHRSIVHLEEIIKSVKSYEEYPNLSERKILEEAIERLEKIDNEILGDSLSSEDVYEAFDFTLNALAKAEVKLSESALKSNQNELAKLSLKQAQIHVKNAFLLDYSNRSNRTKHFDLEVEVFNEIDSLIKSDSISVREMDKRLSKISNELDILMQDMKKRI
ncbi:hypothetical protein [Ekhidna sp.]|jgi:small-conductance mechanosensitive channel|uniref:hypothetical protein n=1 Tax=Ekhidna sp. TaxID=2608089 RepID=UPI0032EAC57E